MAVDLTRFEPTLRSRAGDWEALSVQYVLRPVSPNYGKAMTGAEFENTEWLVSVLLWETGELDLDAGRTADGWLVAKHYDLDSDSQLDVVLTELIVLIRDGVVPTGAFTSWPNRR